MRCGVNAALATLLAVVGCDRATLPATAGHRASERPSEDQAALTDLLRSDPFVGELMRDASRRRLQVLVAAARPTGGIERFAYRVDREYFYPASAVKLCSAVGALEKLEELRAATSSELGLDTTLRFAEDPKTSGSFDTTLRTEIQRALVLSDNDAYGRLHDFVGAAEVNERMARIGLTSVHLPQYGPHVPARSISLRARQGAIAVPRSGELAAVPDGTYDRYLLGAAHIDDHGRHVPRAMDFAQHNRISLRDLSDLLIAVVRPELVEGERAPRLAPAERAFLVDVLGTLPSDLAPKSAPPGLDDFAKPVHRAFARALPGHTLRVLGKSGRAYGFTIGNSYVVDDTTGREAFVAFAIYTNDNETLNDDRYEYVSLANPFVNRLAALVARHFLARPE